MHVVENYKVQKLLIYLMRYVVILLFKQENVLHQSGRKVQLLGCTFLSGYRVQP